MLHAICYTFLTPPYQQRDEFTVEATNDRIKYMELLANDGTQIFALLDTGCFSCTIAYNTLAKFRIKPELLPLENPIAMATASGHSTTLKEYCIIELHFNDRKNSSKIKWPFLISRDLQCAEALLGGDFIFSQYVLTIHPGFIKVSFSSEPINMALIPHKNYRKLLYVSGEYTLNCTDPTPIWLYNRDAQYIDNFTIDLPMFLEECEVLSIDFDQEWGKYLCTIQNNSNRNITLEHNCYFGTIRVIKNREIRDPVGIYSLIPNHPKLNNEDEPQNPVVLEKILHDTIPTKQLYMQELLEDETPMPTLSDEDINKCTPEEAIWRVDVSHVPEKDKAFVREELFKIRDVFATSAVDLGTTPDFADIQLKEGAQPAYAKRRPVPQKVEENAIKLLNKFLECGIIEKREDPCGYCANLHFVEKPDKSLRMTYDSRIVNLNLTRKPATENVGVDHFLRSVGGHQYITSADLAQAFYGIRLTERSKQYVCFYTPLPQAPICSYSRLPMGLAQSSFFLERSLVKALAHQLRVYRFADDLYIVDDNCTLREHFSHVIEVLTALRDYGFKISSKKLVINRPSFICLGLEITNSRLLRIPEKRHIALMNMDVPKTKRSLVRYLFTLNFYAKFFENLVIGAPTLRELSKPKTTFKWTKQAQTEFEETRSKLAKAATLVIPDVNKNIYATCDASNQGFGYCLSQDFKGERYPIMFVSRLFRPSEQRLSTYRQEGYALYSMLKSNYDLFDSCRKEIIISVDARSLIFVSVTSSQLPINFRISMLLAALPIRIRHIAGKYNKISDQLSRHHEQQSQFEYLPVNQSEAIIQRLFLKEGREFSPNEIRELFEAAKRFPSPKVEKPSLKKSSKNPLNRTALEILRADSDRPSVKERLAHKQSRPFQCPMLLRSHTKKKVSFKDRQGEPLTTIYETPPLETDSIEENLDSYQWQDHTKDSVEIDDPEPPISQEVTIIDNSQSNQSTEIQLMDHYKSDPILESKDAILSDDNTDSTHEWTIVKLCNTGQINAEQVKHLQETDVAYQSLMERESAKIKNGVLYIDKKLFIPQAMAFAVIQTIHEMEFHPAKSSFTNMMKQLFWIRHMSTIISRVYDNCLICHLTTKLPRIPQGQLSRATFPRQAWHADLLSGLSATHMDTTIIIFTCDYSLYTVCRRLLNREKQNIFAAIVQHFAAFGNPLSFIGDNEFHFKELQDYCQQHNIKLHLTAAYAKHAAGIIEGRVKTTIDLLRKLYKQYGENFTNVLETAIHASNRRPVPPCKLSPEQKMFAGTTIGNPMWPIHLLKNIANYKEISENDHLTRSKAADRQRQQCNKYRQDIKYDVGDAIMYFDYTMPTKGQRFRKPAFKGPALIIQQLSTHTFEIQDLQPPYRRYERNKSAFIPYKQSVRIPRTVVEQLQRDGIS